MKEIGVLNKQIINLHRKIYNYRIMLIKTPYFDEKMFIINKIDRELVRFEYLLEKFINKSDLQVKSSQHESLKINKEDLKKFNGEGGKPAYVAVNGVIYDVSYNSTWGGGTHFSIEAGQDVTEFFNSCHGGEAILKKLKIVGSLVD